MSPYRPKYPLFLWQVQSLDGSTLSNRCITMVSPIHLILLTHESLSPKPRVHELKEIFSHYLDAHIRIVDPQFRELGTDAEFTLEEIQMGENRYKGTEYGTDLPALSRTLPGKWYLIRERDVPLSEFFY